MKLSTKFIATSGIIAAVYLVLTLFSSFFGMSSGPIQFRLSETLCILPCFTPAAIPGLFVGCLLGNIIAGGAILDIIFGSLATLIGAFGTYLLRRNKWLAVIPPILANALIIPFVLSYGYGFTEGFWYFFATIGASEIISAGVFGVGLYGILKKNEVIFKI